MKTNEVLNNFRNVCEYILLLPFEEQMYEVNKIIKHHSKYNNPRKDEKRQNSTIRDLKDFKKDLIRFHLQELVDNPKLANNSKPLHELLSA